MTDIMLRDIDPELQRRIERVAGHHGWSVPDTLAQLLEIGLREQEVRIGPALDGREHDVLGSAIAALKGLPDDTGFAMIGRAERAA
jgi:plasmid stability protein